MQRVARIGSALAAASIIVGVSSAPRVSSAQEDKRDRGSVDQANQDQSGQGQGHQGQNGQGHNNPDQGHQGQGTADQGAPAAAEVQVVTATAAIQKIDKSAGKLSLKDSKGKTFDVKVGPDVNLGQLHVGDRVNATYYEEVAVAIGKAGQAAPAASRSVTQHGGVTAQQATVTAQIVSVDPNKNTVALRGPQGKTHTLRVEDPDLQAQLRQIKPGDHVNVTYTQAVAVSVEPAK